MKIELRSHTDSRAPDDYNLLLSQRRATSAVNYLISKGIDATRMKGKGYGEMLLVNRCADAVPCTEAEHQANRRTEFIILSL
jgi:outer membrane protein OmpA-like peptidoglycan-associated protein